jgi:mono/diheme cytochrome c family protein
MILALLLAANVAATDANPTGSAEDGRMLAQRNCGGCHAVGKGGASPRTDAPPLRSLQARYPIEDLEEALAEGISVGHPDMPTIEFSPQQIADFQAYLRSLRPASAPGRKGSMPR